MRKIVGIGLVVFIFTTVGVSLVKGMTEKPVEPFEIIIDNSSKEGFTTKGQWMSDQGQGGQNYGTDSLWAYVNPKGTDIAWWRPNLPKDGYYEVFIWYCGDPNNDHATNAPFIVVSDGKTDTFAINLKKNYGKWNSLGIFRFRKGDKGYVSTNSGGNGNAIADAVKFVFVGTRKPKETK